MSQSSVKTFPRDGNTAGPGGGAEGCSVAVDYANCTAPFVSVGVTDLVAVRVPCGQGSCSVAKNTKFHTKSQIRYRGINKCRQVE